MTTHEEERPLNERQSLELIHSMIQSAREDYRQDAFYYLLWGWLVLVAALAHYALLQMGTHNPSLPWMILMPLGGVISGVYGWRQGQRETYRTALGTAINYLWGAFGATLFVVLFCANKLSWPNSYPAIIALYGMGTFTSGGALRFRPLIFGGIACWLLAIGAAYVSFQTQLLLVAASVLVSYIIPGHLLKASSPASSRARTLAAL